MAINFKNPLVWVGGAGVAGVAALLAVMASEDRDATLQEEYGIDAAASCYSLSPQSDYHVSNEAAAIITEARDSALKLGVTVGQDIVNDEFLTDRPICFGSPDYLEGKGIQTGGFTQRYVVVDETLSPQWLVAHFANERWKGMANTSTNRTDNYITEDGILFNRLREAVPDTYMLYARYALANDEQNGYPFESALWGEVAQVNILSDSAKAFEQAVNAGATPEQAWLSSLQTYLVTPEAVDAGDVSFLTWYRDQVGEQETRVYIDITCDADGAFYNDYDIRTTLPEGVTSRDVLTWSLESEIDNECDYEMAAQISEIEAYKRQLASDISDAEDAIDDLESTDPVGDTPAEIEADEAAIKSEISEIEAFIRDAEIELRTVAPEDIEFEWTVDVLHDPASDVHSMAFDPNTLVAYVNHVFGQTGVISTEAANSLVNDQRFQALHSDQADNLYRQAVGNAARYADDNFNPRTVSFGEGLSSHVLRR